MADWDVRREAPRGKEGKEKAPEWKKELMRTFELNELHKLPFLKKQEADFLILMCLGWEESIWK